MTAQTRSIPERLKLWLLGEDVLVVARSLRAEPASRADDGENGTAYTLTHRSGLQVWVGNSAYGMSISAPASSNGFRGVRIWGGVGFLSTFGLSIRHWALWAAARYALSGRPIRVAAAAYLRAGQ